MIDTVKLMCATDAIPREYFTVVKTSETEERSDERWIVVLASVSVTYYPGTSILYVDFSAQDFFSDPLRNHNQQEIDGVFTVVSQRLVDHFGERASEWEFKVQRIDYAVNIEVEDVSVYIHALQAVSLARHKRNIYADSGVNWKSSSRWVKFYNKGLQIGKRVNVLRYEVTLLRRGVAQLAGQLSVPLRVSALARVDVAVYVLMYWLRQLGLLESVDGVSATLVRLRGLVGERELSSAWLVRECASRWGTSCYKPPLSMVSQSTYYKYISLLRGHGLLSCDVSLPSVGGAVARIAKNLGVGAKVPVGLRDQAQLKNFSEKFRAAPDGLVIWEFLHERFALMEREAGESAE